MPLSSAQYPAFAAMELDLKPPKQDIVSPANTEPPPGLFKWTYSGFLKTWKPRFDHRRYDARKFTSDIDLSASMAVTNNLTLPEVVGTLETSLANLDVETPGTAVEMRGVDTHRKRLAMSKKMLSVFPIYKDLAPEGFAPGRTLFHLAAKNAVAMFDAEPQFFAMQCIAAANVIEGVSKRRESLPLLPRDEKTREANFDSYCKIQQDRNVDARLTSSTRAQLVTYYEEQLALVQAYSQDVERMLEALELDTRPQVYILANFPNTALLKLCLTREHEQRTHFILFDSTTERNHQDRNVPLLCLVTVRPGKQGEVYIKINDEKAVTTNSLSRIYAVDMAAYSKADEKAFTGALKEVRMMLEKKRYFFFDSTQLQEGNDTFLTGLHTLLEKTSV